jgi:peptide/nickel transport system permease protein
MSSTASPSRFSRLPALGRTAARALLHALPTVAGVILLSFFLMQAVPGDAADVIAAESGSATADSMAATRRHFGLDLPVLQQLGNYLQHLARLDLGLSPRYNTPVVDLIASRIGNTALLMSTALAAALIAGVMLGTLMASFVGRWPDRVLSLAALLLYSTPGFWLGLMAIILLSVHLGWLPPGGVSTLGPDETGLAHVLDVARHLVLPTLALAGFYVAIFSRLTRAAMLEVSRQDFVRTARAKGAAPLRVTLRHVLRNALMPVLTVAGLNFGTLLGGAVVVETVFSWPGLGRLAYESVMARDYVVLMGILILSSLLVIVANIVVDLAQAALDPRVRAR